VHDRPNGAVQFSHVAPDGYTFQYSNCTGRRKALFIGINYFGQDGELQVHQRHQEPVRLPGGEARPQARGPAS
jgi:hypothetical protein